MGADNSILANVEWGDKYTDAGQDWVIENGELENGIEISMFTVSKKEHRQRDFLRRLAKQLKGIRHPAVLHYIEFGEGSDGPFLITEQVVPLHSVLEKLSAVEICSGLHTILEALSFLHDKAGVCHNNIYQKSIYVCHDGSWRLAGLEHACKFTEATPAYLQACHSFRYQEGLAPEEKQEKIEVKPELGHARDVYSFAVLAEELLEKLTDLGDMTKTFELRIQDECLSPDPKKRPKIESLLNDRLFTTEFLQIATFLKNVALKSEEERKSFFVNLLPKLLSLPEELVGRRLVPLILSRFVILDETACQFVLPHILTPCSDDNLPTDVQEEITPLLSAACYRQFVVPLLIKIFKVHDHHIRMVLLQYFTHYAHLVDPEILECDIFPQLLLGLRDTSGELAASSLRALADLVPILGRDVVIGGRAKNYFRKGMPKKVSNDSVHADNNKPNNVNTVMGKTLLKDLAKFSTQHQPKPLTEEEKEAKWKEKEKRREEAKLRREQRKLERENRLKETKHSTTETEDNISHQANEDKNIPNETVEIQEDIQKHDANNKTGDWSEESFNSEVNEIDRSDSSNQKSHSIGGEVEKDDWSDWDDAEIESQISDEIEKELQAMDVTDTRTQDVKKNDDLYQKRTAVSKLDTSPVHSKKGALKLEKKAKPSKSVNKTVDNQKDIVEVSQTAKVVKISSDKKHSPRGVTKNIPVTYNPNSDLGAEFDVKSVDIKVDPSKNNDPFDFFADMAPTISYSKPLTELNSSEVEASNSKVTMEKNDDTQLKVDGAKFGVIQATQEETEADGWGNDDWTTEDF